MVGIFLGIFIISVSACGIALTVMLLRLLLKTASKLIKCTLGVVFAALTVCVIASVCFLTAPEKNIEIENGSYTLSGISYYNGAYSCIHDEKNEKIVIENTSGMHIYRFVGEELLTEAIYEEVKPDKDDLESLFEGTPILTDYENAKDFIRDNEKAWYHISADDTACYPYMLFLQKDGSLYMAFADFENGKPVRVRHIYELELFSTDTSSLLKKPTSTDYTMYSYTYEEGVEVYPTVYLSQTDDFAVLTWMDYSIHKTTVIGQGKYVIDKKELIVTCNDTYKTYVFDAVSEREYKFNENKSSENPEYKLSSPENSYVKIDTDKLFKVSGETNALPSEVEIARESAYMR